MSIAITSSASKDMTRIRALVYGETGCGKTTSLAALPEDRTLIAVSERGLLPLRHKNFRVAVLESWTDVREFAKMMQLAIVDDRIVLEGKPIECIVLDSLSDALAMAIRHIVEVDRRALFQERGNTNKPKGVYDDLLALEDYNLLSSRMHAFLSATTHLPAHIIVTSLATSKEDKQTGKTRRVPAVPGQLADQIGRYFDLLISMESMMRPGEDGKPESIRVFRTANDGTSVAKDASGVLPALMEASWPMVFKMIAPKSASNGTAPTTPIPQGA